MPYTLAKGFFWFALAMLLGIVIGWLLRSIVAKRQIARARTQHVDAAEMERLRGRVANLEPVVAERDRLRAELDAERSVAAVARDESPDVRPEDEAAVPGLIGGAAAGDAPVDRDVGGDDLGDGPSAPSTPDIDAAAHVLGRAIELDDLKVVEGIGPKIEALCNGIGIRTWFDLSVTEVSLLRTMLTDAGARFKGHDPSSWPQQAELLAHGRWEEFLAMTDALQGGRAVD